MNCRVCGKPVLRVFDPDTRLRVDLDSDPVPVTRHLAPDLLLFQQRADGWHCLTVNERTGWPVHQLHAHAQGES